MEALLALWKKLVLSLLVLVALLVGAAVQAVVGWRAVLFGPSARALTGRSFEATPERIERGAQRPAEVGAAHAATFVQVMRTGKLGTLSPTMPWAAVGRADAPCRSASPQASEW